MSLTIDEINELQAENERLKAERDLARYHALLCASERGQAQARVARLRDACETMLAYLDYALGPGDGLYLAHDTQTLPAEIVKMKAALAEGDGDAGLDHADSCSRRQIGNLYDPKCNCGLWKDADAAPD